VYLTTGIDGWLYCTVTKYCVCRVHGIPRSALLPTVLTSDAIECFKRLLLGIVVAHLLQIEPRSTSNHFSSNLNQYTVNVVACQLIQQSGNLHMMRAANVKYSASWQMYIQGLQPLRVNSSMQIEPPIVTCPRWKAKRGRTTRMNGGEIG
jgi:hypothetical protein